MTKCLKPATEMMRTNAGFHADQARRHVCKPCFHLATRPLLTQHGRAALIKADKTWNEFLPTSMSTTAIAVMSF